MTYATSAGTLVVSISMPVLAVIVVALRFYSRVAHNTPASWDDWLIVPATVWQAVYQIIISAMLSLVLQVLTVALGGIMVWGESLLVFAELFPILKILGVVDNGLGRPTPTAKTSGAENQNLLVTKVSFPRNHSIRFDVLFVKISTIAGRIHIFVPGIAWIWLGETQRDFLLPPHILRRVQEQIRHHHQSSHYSRRCLGRGVYLCHDIRVWHQLLGAVQHGGEPGQALRENIKACRGLCHIGRDNGSDDIMSSATYGMSANPVRRVFRVALVKSSSQIWTLQMSTRRKITATSIFLLGSL